MNQQPKYRFYPSLLDKFEQYLRADEQVESFWNVDNETGEYKKSPEVIEAELKQSLLDAINRVPFESEAADKGTAFNAVIDCYIHKKSIYQANGSHTPLSVMEKRIPFRYIFLLLISRQSVISYLTVAGV